MFCSHESTAGCGSSREKPPQTSGGAPAVKDRLVASKPATLISGLATGAKKLTPDNISTETPKEQVRWLNNQLKESAKSQFTSVSDAMLEACIKIIETKLPTVSPKLQNKTLGLLRTLPDSYFKQRLLIEALGVYKLGSKKTTSLLQAIEVSSPNCGVDLCEEIKQRVLKKVYSGGAKKKLTLAEENNLIITVRAYVTLMQRENDQDDCKGLDSQKDFAIAINEQLKGEDFQDPVIRQLFIHACESALDCSYLYEEGEFVQYLVESTSGGTYVDEEGELTENQVGLTAAEKFIEWLEQRKGALKNSPSVGSVEAFAFPGSDEEETPRSDEAYVYKGGGEGEIDILNKTMYPEDFEAILGDGAELLVGFEDEDGSDPFDDELSGPKEDAKGHTVGAEAFKEALQADAYEAKGFKRGTI